MSGKSLDPKNYEVQWIPCKNLSVVWIESQRKLDEAKAKNIADNFDPDQLDPLKVTLPNGAGMYHICDGQNRKRAIELALGADQCAPCIVAPNGNPVKAAKIFLGTNTTRRSPSKIDHFKVSVTAQEQLEVNIHRVLQRYSYRVDNTGSEGAISAVAALKFVYLSCGGKPGLDRTMNLLRMTWGNDRNAVNGHVIRGFGAFLNEFHSHLDTKKFAERISKKWTPGQLLQESKTMRSLHGGSAVETIKQMLLAQYNRGAINKLKSKSAEK